MSKRAQPDNATDELNDLITGLSPETAEDLKDRVNYSDYARRSIIDTIRLIGKPLDEPAAELLTLQMDWTEVGYPEDEPDNPATYSHSGYCAEDGFTPVRQTITALACRETKKCSVRQLADIIEEMDQWLQCADAMKLTPKLDTWQDCIQANQEWHDHVVNRQDSFRAAQIVGHKDGKFTAWTAVVETHRMQNFIMAVILKEEDLLTESVRLDPDFYPRYLKECRANRAKPFAIINNDTGETMGLCLLRYRKKKWYLAQPTFLNISHMADHYEGDLEADLKQFGRTYHQAYVKNAGSNRNSSSNEDTAPPGNPHGTCKRCQSANIIPRTRQRTRPMKDKNRQHSPIYCVPCRNEAEIFEEAHQGAKQDQRLGENQVSTSIPTHRAAGQLTTCQVCYQTSFCITAETTEPTDHPRGIAICNTCAAATRHAATAQLITVSTVHNGNQRDTQYWLVACPNCPNLAAHRGKSKRTPPCHDCVAQTIVDLRRILQGADDETLEAEAKLLGVYPENRCIRCQPARQSKNEPYSTPARCITCRQHYRNTQGVNLPPQPHGLKKECRCCYSKEGFPVATDTLKRRTSICALCAQIATQYHVFAKNNEELITVSLCETRECSNIVYDIPYCDQCRRDQENQWRNRQFVVNHLHDVLESRQKEAPEPAPSEFVALIIRDDSTTVRMDSKVGRLNPELAQELCREYVDEERELPELALRFQVSIPMVRSTLQGKTWSKHTQGRQPKKLRLQPRRITAKPEEQTEKPPKPAYITPTRIRGEYGWTDTLIAQHLGEHDRNAPNPHYSTADPMRLYLLDRVHEAMANKPALRQQLQKNLDRRKVNQAEHEKRTLKRREELLHEAEGLKPVVRRLPSTNAKKLMSMATRKRIEFLQYSLIYDDYDLPVDDDSPLAEARAVSMLRHEFTNYEELLEQMPRSRDMETNALIYQSIKGRVLNAIAESVPELAQACHREAAQMATEFF